MEDKELNILSEAEESFEDIETLEEEDAEEQPTDTANAELEARRLELESEIASLEEKLENARLETDRKAKEYAEFRELFPYADPNELDGEVVAMVEAGVPLAAAYSLYEKRLSAKNAAVAAHNNATKQGGFGSVGRGAEEEFYTPDEVRAMTQSEVKRNYQKILRSMKNWH